MNIQVDSRWIRGGFQVEFFGKFGTWNLGVFGCADHGGAIRFLEIPHQRALLWYREVKIANSDYRLKIWYLRVFGCADHGGAIRFFEISLQRALLGIES